MMRAMVLSGLMLLALASQVFGQAKATFDNDDAVKGWTTKGDVAVDAEKNRDGGGGGALKVGPGGEARLMLRDTNGAGKVELHVFEDGTVAAEPKTRGAGAMWGLLGKDGNVLVVGAIYAPFLSGDTTYTASDWNPTVASEQPFAKVQYLGLKRAEGWHKWTFDLDPQKGLTISYDGKDVNGKQKRFDWNKTRLDGFAGVVVFGDRAAGGKQVVWIDDLSAELGGAMQATLVAPAPPPPAMPATDPQPEKKLELAAAVKGKHPRLLFTAEDLPALRDKAKGEGKVFWDQLLAYLPVSRAPNTPVATDATDAQRQGLWRAPTVAVHYAITGDKKSLEAAKGMLEWMVKHDNWEEGSERDSGMGAANIAIGAGILYDVLYNDLDPEFREKARQKLLLQARKQWYLGHLNGNKAVGYWQGDPQNNHRWHRNAGMAMCALGVAGDGPGDEFILSTLASELDFIAKWLPEDGTSHESPSYMVFGAPHLYLAMDAADRVLGTKHLDHPFFKHIPMFRVQTLTPGLKDVFDFGDSGGTGGINSFVFKSTGHHKLADLQDAMLKFYKAHDREGGKGNGAFQFGVYSFLWYDPSVKGGSIENLPKTYYFDDLGLVFARDGWAEDNVGLFFKCAPYGGYLLNEYRRDKGLANVNVAHDDPDVNMFQIFTGGKIVARDDGYAKDKLTSSHNTILVNGKGQRGEGGVWMQPIKNFDMAQLGVMTTYKDTGDIVIAEGEGAGAYPGLSRYRRTAVWVKGGYVLLIDDIRGQAQNEITWLVQGDDLAAVDASAGRYQLKSGSASCDFMLTADTELASEIGTSTADQRGKNMGLKQLQAKAKGATVRYAAVFDPWKRGDLKVELKAQDADHAVITVTGKDINDTWTWTAAPAMTYTPATLKGQRAGGFTVEAGPADQAKIPYKDLPPIQPAGAVRPGRRG